MRSCPAWIARPGPRSHFCGKGLAWQLKDPMADPDISRRPVGVLGEPAGVVSLHSSGFTNLGPRKWLISLTCWNGDYRHSACVGPFLVRVGNPPILGCKSTHLLIMIHIIVMWTDLCIPTHRFATTRELPSSSSRFLHMHNKLIQGQLNCC